MICLVLGGEKSGKSAAAWRMFSQAPGEGTVLAMGCARDQAFRRQILDHRLERGPGVPVEEPGLLLPEALTRAASSGRNVLVDSLDFWLFSCMEAQQDMTGQLLASLAHFDGAHSARASARCILVSCEVGLGPVARTPLTRKFARAQGALNQAVAQAAGHVWLVVAGQLLKLK